MVVKAGGKCITFETRRWRGNKDPTGAGTVLLRGHVKELVNQLETRVQKVLNDCGDFVDVREL